MSRKWRGAQDATSPGCQNPSSSNLSQTPAQPHQLFLLLPQEEDETQHQAHGQENDSEDKGEWHVDLVRVEDRRGG